MEIKEQYIDPVCRIAVDPAHAEARLDYQGQPLYFCSQSCLKAFENEPEQYGFGKRKGFWRRYLDRLNKVTEGRQSSCRG